MNVSAMNTATNKCSAKIEYTRIEEKENLVERLLSACYIISTIIGEVVDFEKCKNLEEALALTNVIQDMTKGMTKDMLEISFAVKDANEKLRVYQIAVEAFNDWIDLEFDGDEQSFENQYKNSTSLEVDIGYEDEKNAYFYISNSSKGNILAKFPTYIADDDEKLELVAIEAFMVALVISDRIFEDVNENPIRIMSKDNPVDGGFTELAKKALKEETNEKTE